MDWASSTKPGGGSSAPGIDFYSPDEGYVTDTNSKVYGTTDGGDSWETVGINGASVGLYDVGAINEDDLDVAGGSGTIFRLNGAVWTKLAISGSGLNALEREGENGLTVGGSGTVYRRTWTGWEREETSSGSTLNGVTFGTTGPDVAVGSSGTILERQI